MSANYCDESVYSDVEREARNHWHAERPSPGPPDYDEQGIERTYPACAQGGCYHWRHDLPCPPDPWQEQQIQCQRCDEFREPACTHGNDLCGECIWTCRDCNEEMAEQQAYDDDRDEL